jgi:hypothetical protein
MTLIDKLLTAILAKNYANGVIAGISVTANNKIIVLLILEFNPISCFLAH